MDKQPQNIQDGFLNSARKEKLLVTVYLLSGVKLTGRIRSFDKYSLILESNHQEQMVFKHAIATVVLPRAMPTAGGPWDPGGIEAFDACKFWKKHFWQVGNPLAAMA